MKKIKNPTACIIIIGNEILSGRTLDTNKNYLCKELTAIGIDVLEARVVKDDEKQIISSVNELRKKYNYVFTTGGIGPTHDDITSNSIAKAFKVKLIKNKKALNILKKFYNAVKEQGKLGLEAEVVSKKIKKVIEMNNPKTRYVITGKKLINYTLPSILPDRWFAKLTAKLLGIKKSKK